MQIVGQPAKLPLPKLEKHDCLGISYLTDDGLARASGTRIAFTYRYGGFSKGDYSGLDLASHVGDDLEDVLANRSLLQRALGADGMPLVVPSQIHGTEIVTIADNAPDHVEAASAKALEGADGILVATTDVAALLCYADCVPVIIVSPTGKFAVVHSGWRGVMGRISDKAVEELSKLDTSEDAPVDISQYNVYIGPHIHSECFETGRELRDDFVSEFGEAAAYGKDHVDLSAAIRASLEKAGVSSDRILDSGLCTMCNPDKFYSYRAEGGVCGRHGAIAFRKVAS